MKEFWDNHKKGILGFVGGMIVMVGMVAANTFCGRLPPPFSTLCVGVAQQVVNEIRVSIQPGDGGDATTIATTTTTTQAPAADLCPGAPDGDFCTSNGYALPLPDGGRCRCR